MRLGKGVKQRAADQLAAKLLTGLRAGESIEWVYWASNVRLSIDRLVLTNLRLLGVESRKGAVKVSIDRDALVGATAGSNWAGKWVEVAVVSGVCHKFSMQSTGGDTEALVALLAVPPFGVREAPKFQAPSAGEVARYAANMTFGGPVGAKEVAARAQTKSFEKEREIRVLEEYGELRLAKRFGLLAVEIYSKGFVRVGAVTSEVDTPFERLRGIDARVVVQEKSAGGRALASALSMGVSRLYSNEHRIAYLTITTDKQTHALRWPGGDIPALALEAAGNAVLGGLQDVPAPPASPPTAADRLRQLALLREDGLLSADEFAAAKARLVEEL